MKVSVSGLPKGTPNVQFHNSHSPGSWFLGSWKLQVGLVSATYLAAHLPFLAPSLEDYDSINFALGLRDFDPARHQPHPPGSPVYIALGRIVFFVVNSVLPAADRPATEALALALLSAVGGALAIVAFAWVCLRMFAPDRDATVAWAAAIFAASPLMWISGLRPMSDLPGLAAALAAQALMLTGRSGAWALIAGGLVAGLAAGIRVQTLSLTLPLFAFVLIERRLPWRPLAAAAAGVLAWGVPLVLDSGGVDAYLRALGSQAGEDFAWVNMLWLEPTPRRLAFALYETFVLPWGALLLAAAVGAAAVAGVLRAATRQPTALGMCVLAFGPYTLLHLLLQETITVRYALPTLPLVAWLAANAAAGSRRWTPVVAAPLVAAGLFVAVPDAIAYARAPHPAFQALADAVAYARLAPPQAVYAHHSLWRAVQAAETGLPVVEPPRLHEWLGPVNYWTAGGRGHVWFLADPRRTDLDLIDPQSRLDAVHYRWAVDGRPEFSGIRPVGADWYRLAPPGWFASEGWSLTPETGGLALATARGPDRRPIEAWLRRRAEPMHLVIGGRHLGNAGDPAADFELAIDGAVRDRWTTTVDERNFLRFMDLPDGLAGAGDYARLTVASRPAGGDRRQASSAVRQFDVQPAGRMISAFGEGWHEEEYDPATGRRWRWTSGRAVLRVKGPVSDVDLVLRGESPLRYFDAPPDVQVTAGGRIIARFQPAADFAWTVRIPAADVGRAAGAIAIETTPVYRPGEAEGTADERELGLRLFETRLIPLNLD